MSDSLRIVHMASLARSGETVLLRTLAAHPQVHVVHDLHAVDNDASLRLYRLLRVWPEHRLPRWQLDRHIAPATVAPDKTVLLLKQGVFAPRFDAAGFGLVRNPYAAFCSLWSYDAKRLGQPPDAALNLRNWQRLRLPRLLVWVDAMLPALLPAIRAETDPVRQFLLFWRARVAQIVATQRCVVLYEDFVNDPATVLRQVCDAIALPYAPAMLLAHEGHARGERGHGGIDLSAAIRPGPAWTPDPLVDPAPFADCVDSGPFAAWRGLYRAETAAPPARVGRPLRVLFIGHSHLRCVRDAVASDAPALAARGVEVRTLLLRPAVAGSPVVPGRDADLLPAEQRAEVLRSAPWADHIVLAVGGNAHSVFGLVEHARPFDFELAGESSPPLLPGREPLPGALVAAALRDSELFRQQAAMRRWLCQLSPAPCLELESPPPPRDDAHILAHPGHFGPLLAEHGVAPAALRYKIWRLQSAAVRQACNELGLRFLPAPASVRDAQGFLVPQALADDPTHANPWYGRQLIEQVLCELDHAERLQEAA